MALVKVSEIDLDFPVVGFCREAGVLWFGDISLLTRCSIADVKAQTLIGMEMFDNRMRSWIVRSLDLNEPLPPRRWWQISPDRAHVDFELNLEQRPPIDFDKLKRRLLPEMGIEDPDDEKAARKAPDLAALCEVTYIQATGLL